MSTNTIEEEWDVLKAFFPEGWEEKAFETRALVRRRKIDRPETLLRVLLIHLADGKSLRSTACYAKEANLCSINDSALLNRLRASGEWLRWMADRLREELGSEGGFFNLSEKFRVRLIDGSMISEPGSTGSNWRLHYSLNLRNLNCDEFQVTDYKTGENFTHYSIRPGDILIADRGYCKKSGISYVFDSGGHVLLRFHSTLLPLFDYRGNRLNILEKLRDLSHSQVGDWDVYIYKEDGTKIKGRLCALRKSKESAERAKKEILKAARKKQRKVKPETLEHAEYFTVFTTISRRHLKAHEVMELFRARWQVELSFKRLKGIIDLGHLPKIDPESCKAWLHGKLFVALLIERIFREAESFSPWGYPCRKGAFTVPGGRL